MADRYQLNIYKRAPPLITRNKAERVLNCSTRRGGPRLKVRIEVLQNYCMQCVCSPYYYIVTII